MTQEAQAKQPRAHITSAGIAAVALPTALQFRRQASLLPVAPEQHMDPKGEAIYRLRPGFKTVGSDISGRDRWHRSYILANANSVAALIQRSLQLVS